jgi:peptidoglycan/xylan/chitin deacetylase (PgdA/CDA1 family)
MLSREKIWLIIAVAACMFHTLTAFVFIYLETKELNDTLAIPIIIPETRAMFLAHNVLLAAESENNDVPLAVPAPGKDFILEELFLFETEDLEQEEAKKENETFFSSTISYIPVLMYHHIDYISSKDTAVKKALTVEPGVFEEQMKHLYNNGYQPIDFQELIVYLDNKEKIPENFFIITFDDGWKSQYQHALPVLKKYNLKATFFPVVNYIGGGSFVNWSELRKLSESGMEIGSHSMNHPNLRGLPLEHLEYELKASKAALERELNQTILSFAYPYCAFDSNAQKSVNDAGYRIGRFCGANDEFKIVAIDFGDKKSYNIDSIQVNNNLAQFKRYFPLISALTE